MVEMSPPARNQRRAPFWLYICVVGIFVLGTGLRLIDLTDPPLDYFPQRQLRGAIIARAIYYKLLPSVDTATRELAVSLSNIMDIREPSILEGLVANTYLVTGGEHLWVARIYSILFWLLGGIALYALARRLTSPAAAIAPLIYYFFLPWSVIFSRIFQPDILMVMLILWAAYALYRWSESLTWKWAILTGFIAGMAGLVKLPAIFPLALMIIGVVLTTLGIKKAITNLQVWVMGVLFLVFPAVYYLFVIPSISRDWFNSTIQLISNWVQPSFYMRWIIFAGGMVDLGVAFISFVGIWLLPKKARIIPLALWAGYALYGLAFPHHIITHEYYTIPLIPAIALSLAPVANLIFSRINQFGRGVNLVVAAVMLFSIAYSGWMGRSILVSKNYRSEPAGWIKVGQAIPKDGHLIGITHEQGYRLIYYAWRFVTPWPYTTEDEQSLTSKANPQAEFQTRFENAIQDQDYFVVTLFGEFDSQPMLKAYLYDHFPIYAQSDSYLIFDLTHPKESAP